jgi:hypothetical protein
MALSEEVVPEVVSEVVSEVAQRWRRIWWWRRRRRSVKDHPHLLEFFLK